MEDIESMPSCPREAHRSPCRIKSTDTTNTLYEDLFNERDLNVKRTCFGDSKVGVYTVSLISLVISNLILDTQRSIYRRNGLY
jgi:hypothetical protein